MAKQSIDAPLRAAWTAGAVLLALTTCSRKETEIDLQGSPSSYLVTFVGDLDEKEPDFLLTIDVDPTSEQRGQPIETMPIGHHGSVPHHMEYERPPNNEVIFVNAHQKELTMIVDIDNRRSINIAHTFEPPAPYRFPHDYQRTPNGTRLVGFLRSDGASPDPNEATTPGNHGGIGEYTNSGELLRTVSAAAPGLKKAVRPYAFALLPEIDRFVVTSAPMMESSWADVIQIYRYSDFSLLHTLDLPVGRDAQGQLVEGSQAAGFGPRILDDGTVFLNAYGCAFYHLTDIDTTTPSLEMVYTIQTDPVPHIGKIRGACSIPVRVAHYWIQSVSDLNSVVVLDISDPREPFEVHRINTPKWFKPHWLAKDKASNRLVMGAELGGEDGFFILRIDTDTGRIGFDPDFKARRSGSLFAKSHPGYIKLRRQDWPHGQSGNAWGHAALFWQDE
ncbi:MAG: hypothetical protein HKP25_14515 [Marinicaulis sp.]|nr:hypothetical protein [Marinicaulis sp.]